MPSISIELITRVINRSTSQINHWKHVRQHVLMWTRTHSRGLDPYLVQRYSGCNECTGPAGQYCLCFSALHCAGHLNVSQAIGPVNGRVWGWGGKKMSAS